MLVRRATDHFVEQSAVGVPGVDFPEELAPCCVEILEFFAGGVKLVGEGWVIDSSCVWACAVFFGGIPVVEDGIEVSVGIGRTHCIVG